MNARNVARVLLLVAVGAVIAIAAPHILDVVVGALTGPAVEVVDTAPGVPHGEAVPPPFLNEDGTLPVSGPPTE